MAVRICFRDIAPTQMQKMADVIHGITFDNALMLFFAMGTFPFFYIYREQVNMINIYENYNVFILYTSVQFLKDNMLRLCL